MTARARCLIASPTLVLISGEVGGYFKAALNKNLISLILNGTFCHVPRPASSNPGQGGRGPYLLSRAFYAP